MNGKREHLEGITGKGPPTWCNDSRPGSDVPLEIGTCHVDISPVVLA